MRLKSFYGPNMTEVMRSVRDALGDGAIIVATRDDENGGMRVTVAIEEATQASAQNKSQLQAVPTPDGSEAVECIAKALLQHQVSTAIAERILATATQYASEDPLLAFGAALDTHFKFMLLPDEEPSKPLLLIGPPGAGKTLYAAKLATKAIMAKRPVVLISTDTARAGGMAQLAAFGRILGQEILEIEDPHALQDAISIQPPGTLILIDTAGANPFLNEDRAILTSLIKCAGALPLLVLPADMDALESIDSAKEFISLGAQGLLATRLDMTRRAGGLLRMAYETHLPLCTFSASAQATQAPFPFNPVSLARLILPSDRAKGSQDQARSA